MTRTRNEKGQFNYKYQGAREFIASLMAEGKNSGEIVGLTLKEFEGISYTTVLWYMKKINLEKNNA